MKVLIFILGVIPVCAIRAIGSLFAWIGGNIEKKADKALSAMLSKLKD